MKLDTFTSDHDDYRGIVTEFLRREVVPHYDRWEKERIIDRSAWLAAGKFGIVGLPIPTEYGGGGEHDFRYRVIAHQEIARAAVTSFGMGCALQDDIVLPYFLDLATEDQKRRWLPGMAAGELIGAIAMTEPDAGSDLQAIRTSATPDGADWIINGQKTFISSGYLADVVIVAARTDPGRNGRALSLFVVERDMPGFERGRKLSKIGLAAQDTAELVFDNVRVPAHNLLGEVGFGFKYMMQRLPRERMTLAAGAVASSAAALNWATDYVFSRKVFDSRIGDLQNTRFVLAELETELDMTLAYFDRAVTALNNDTLTSTEAAKIKWWASEQQLQITTRCLQLFGGYGYMTEYPIARAYTDARIQTIYGGTTEIMKEIIGRDIAARHPA